VLATQHQDRAHRPVAKSKRSGCQDRAQKSRERKINLEDWPAQDLSRNRWPRTARQRATSPQENELSLGSTLVHAPQQVGSGHGTKTKREKIPPKKILLQRTKTTAWDPTKGIISRLH
jgi:hypothetical protein